MLVANPADKMIYYYTEGMAAPMGSFQNYKRDPRALLVLDNSLRETERGVYTSNRAITDSRVTTTSCSCSTRRGWLTVSTMSVAENPALPRRPRRRSRSSHSSNKHSRMPANASRCASKCSMQKPERENRSAGRDACSRFSRRASGSNAN